MPRRVHVAPELRFHAASGRFYVTLDGRRHYLGRLPAGALWKKGDAVPRVIQQAYAKAIADFQPETQAAVHPVMDAMIGAAVAPVARGVINAVTHHGEQPYPLTVAELILAYWKWASARYVKRGKPTGEINRIRAALRPLRKEYAERLADDFRISHLYNVREKLIEHRYGRDGQERYTRQVINGYVAIVVRMFRWAAVKEYVRPTLWGELKVLPSLKIGEFGVPEEKHGQPVSVATVLRTLPQLDSGAANCVRFLGLMGCRDDAGTIPRACDFPVDPLLGRVYRPQWHKTEHFGKSGDVPVSEAAWAFIEPLIEQAPAPDAYLFINPRTKNGGRYNTGTIVDAVARAAKAAGVEHWTPGQLRHAKLTQLRHTQGLEAAQRQGAHGSSRMTERYAKLLPDPIDIDQAMLQWKPGCDVEALIKKLTPTAGRSGQRAGDETGKLRQQSPSRRRAQRAARQGSRSRR